MVFQNQSKHAICDINVRFGDVPIEKVETIRYLGVMMDHNLSWTSHINNVTNKLSSIAYTMHKIRSFVSETTSQVIYNSLAKPHLTFCNENWGFTYKKHLKKINVIQKHLIRIIDNLKKDRLQNHILVFIIF